MSLNERVLVVALALLSACSVPPAGAAEVCPARSGQPLRYVDVFDGAPEEMATLVPDNAQPRSGHWQLGYVYDAGRTVTIRCKYADGQAQDVKLSSKVERCDYKLDDGKKLTVSCK